MILGPDGEKLSKRHGAVNVMEYDSQGYLPEAMVNYLARLGWGHGDDEIFTREQLIEWFDTRSLSKSASQWDPKKLNWVNAHYIKNSSNDDLAARVAPRIQKQGGNPQAVDLGAVMGLLKDRAETLVQLAEGAMLFCGPYVPASPELLAENLDEPARALLGEFARQAKALPEWNTPSISGLIKSILTEQGVKMPKLAIPLRLAVTGQKQTPAIDAVLAIVGRDRVLERLAAI
jgi:glutamyl-tRNA synthetase